MKEPEYLKNEKNKLDKGIKNIDRLKCSKSPEIENGGNILIIQAKERLKVGLLIIN
jgi:hypothetical protein